jgi:preprotein translocase subunit SecA
MFQFIKKIFGTQQTRTIKRYLKTVQAINQQELAYQSLSDDELKAKTLEFKERLQGGESIDNLLIEAFAVVKNTCRRLVGTEIHVSGYNQKWDMIPYDVQILGGIALFHGSIAEMHTGEGKTLTASFPLYLRALTGKPVHLVTVNDYLAERDCQWVGEIFRFHGLNVQPLTGKTMVHDRKKVYEADIVYGTASEFGFDYLRDNSMAQSKDEQCQRGHYFALIDEVDSILIDEARTPLIISGPSHQSFQMYGELSLPVLEIVKKQRDFCNKIAGEALKTLTELNLVEEREDAIKWTKELEEKSKGAIAQLWLVSKGMPKHKIVKRLKQNPDLRMKLEALETFYYAEPNRLEKHEKLADLYIVVDERGHDFELTDKGIHAWAELNMETSHEDFTMMDVGYEYTKIEQSPQLTEEQKIAKKMQIRDQDAKRKERAHNVRQLFRAHLMMEKDVDYIVHDEKIVIIDENTGRPQPGRRFSDGLHQAIEAKENLEIQQETQTYATITLQNYFRMYEKLAGMTGTAITEAFEFKEIYKLQVLEIPTHKPCVRKDANDELYMTEREKYQAILQEVHSLHEKGRPILIGTESVDVSEKLSRILKQAKLPHSVLNAKQNDKEAEIISQAGRHGAITVSTNMAGRGTDIKLDPEALAAGGLHVIGTTRHHSRRIDRQLRGRSARGGDPGSSKFYVSFEDSLMRLFASSPTITNFLQKHRPPEGEPISAPILNKSIETAQKRIEQRNYNMRKHTLEYDDVMNKQRQEVYAFRNSLLHDEDVFSLIFFDIVHPLCEIIVEKNLHGKLQKESLEEFAKTLMLQFPIKLDVPSFVEKCTSIHKVVHWTFKEVSQLLKRKLEFQAQIIALIQEATGKSVDPKTILQDVIRNLLIRIVDRKWQDHLLAIDHLRNEVGIRAVGQKDPLQEFKHEAFHLFSEFSDRLKYDFMHGLFSFEMMVPQSEELRKSIERVQSYKVPQKYLDLDAMQETEHHT